MRIAIDAMGGDYAPEAMVAGVMLAKAVHPEVSFQLYGDESQIRPHVTDMSQVTIVHATEKITSEDDPVKAVRKKKDSSMVRAAKAVKDGQADALISAGNTGALLASGIFVIGRIKQIDRPALMSTLPTQDGRGFDMLDLGANAENQPNHLQKFALLGSFYAKYVRGVDKPRVALLNNGSEASKGAPLQQATYQLLAQDSDIHFIGNIEARELLQGQADVVVSDGFTGNAVLKATEGTAMSIMGQLKQAVVSGGLRTKIGGWLLKPALMQLRQSLDYESAGGAVLFGVKAPVVKTHGSSKAKAVASTIKQTVKMLETDVVGQLIQHYQENPNSDD